MRAKGASEASRAPSIVVPAACRPKELLVCGLNRVRRANRHNRKPETGPDPAKAARPRESPLRLLARILAQQSRIHTREGRREQGSRGGGGEPEPSHPDPLRAREVDKVRLEQIRTSLAQDKRNVITR